MNPPRPHRAIGVLAAFLVSLLLVPAWAEEATSATAGAAPATPPLGHVVSALLVGAFAAAGVGCLLAVLRIVFPHPTATADRAVSRLASGRLLLTGILPALGVGLLGQAVGHAGVPFLGGAYALVVLLPAAALALLGAMAAVPHLGRGLLGAGHDRSLLVSVVTGALVLTLAGAAAVVLGRAGGAALFGLLVGGWFLGTGLGAALDRANGGAAPTAPGEAEAPVPGNPDGVEPE